MEAGSCPCPDTGSQEQQVYKPLESLARHSLSVKVDDSIYVVDKDVLTQNCEYFRALFQSGMKECQQEEIHLKCLGAVGFFVMLRILNGEWPMLSSNEIVEAIECTAFLQVNALTKYLINITNSENCLLMYSTAASYGVWELFHSSALFIRDIYSDLEEDVHTLPRELVDYIKSLIPSSYMVVCSHSPAIKLLQDFQRTVCYLDEGDKEWKVLTHLPKNTSTTMAGVAVLDNKLYIIGGVHDVSKKVVDAGFCYNPETDTWCTIPSPNQLRYNFTLIGHEDCLYAIGGEYDRKAMSSVERYRVSNGTWSFASNLPCPAASLANAKTMSRIFICLWMAKGATNIHEYVPEKDQWVLVTTLIREQSYALCMVAHKENLYVMRNGPCDDFLLCVMDCYNLSSGQWTAMPGQYGNSKGSLLTAVVRGDSVFTLSRLVTTEYTIRDYKWKTKKKMEGFGRIGSMYTFLMRLPKPTVSRMGDAEALTHTPNYGGLFDSAQSSMQCFEKL
ncbi:kelch repeat and BTB domain-containing protein 13 [Lampris incognitus]|uniref:kelch repeat and BTB domain-containing protein 13 n=1 Tax=Lampris incognitus TaxID=2546036 RepID=UPI0024B56BF0|nr:kelch repeat and BTB domain-containing protein 13 [Lampris incognitus]